jgi:two-component system, sensor histidine kinase
VGNAIKFTEHGAVVVGLSLRHSQGLKSATLEITVTDTGVGIVPASIKTIFERFSQADESSTRQFGGTGLGLALTRQLAQGMHGDVSVPSEPGKGSTFTATVVVDVPTNGATQLVETIATPIQRLHGHVLVAEDNVVNQRVARAMLERVGLSVTMVENGQEALQRVEEGGYDAILMDCDMPVVNGLQAIRAIRERERKLGVRRIPIIALTAGALSEDQDRCLAAGMDAHVPKPLDATVLAKRLGPFVGGVTINARKPPRQL